MTINFDILYKKFNNLRTFIKFSKIKNKNKIDAAAKKDVGGDDQLVFFLFGLSCIQDLTGSGPFGSCRFVKKKAHTQRT